MGKLSTSGSVSSEFSKSWFGVHVPGYRPLGRGPRSGPTAHREGFQWPLGSQSGDWASPLQWGSRIPRSPGSVSPENELTACPGWGREAPNTLGAQRLHRPPPQASALWVSDTSAALASAEWTGRLLTAAPFQGTWFLCWFVFCLLGYVTTSSSMDYHMERIRLVHVQSMWAVSFIHHPMHAFIFLFFVLRGFSYLFSFLYHHCGIVGRE